MEALEKRKAALELLASKGIARSSYEPIATRLLWGLGIDVPPPHFASFGSIATGFGLYFGVVWGLIMWLMLWSRRGMPVPVALLSACAAGLFFGLSMAGYYVWARRKLGLPAWKDFKVAK